ASSPTLPWPSILSSAAAPPFPSIAAASGPPVMLILPAIGCASMAAGLLGRPWLAGKYDCAATFTLILWPTDRSIDAQGFSANFSPFILGTGGWLRYLS